MFRVNPLLRVWVLLQLLLVATIGASLLLSGTIGLVFSLTVAATKSGLIYWRYMHLGEQPSLSRVAALAAGAWLLILLAFVGLDYFTRGIA